MRSAGRIQGTWRISKDTGRRCVWRARCKPGTIAAPEVGASWQTIEVAATRRFELASARDNAEKWRRDEGCGSFVSPWIGTRHRMWLPHALPRGGAVHVAVFARQPKFIHWLPATAGARCGARQRSAAVVRCDNVRAELLFPIAGRNLASRNWRRIREGAHSARLSGGLTRIYRAGINRGKNTDRRPDLTA